MPPTTSQHYPDLLSLIVDIIAHTDEHGDFIEQANLEKQMIFGWKCTKTEKIWTIQLSKVRRLGIWCNDPIAPIVRKMIEEHQNREKTPEHWQLRVIHDDQIKRLIRMKAFW